MKYMLLIHQGDAPTPYSDKWDSLSFSQRPAITDFALTYRKVS